MELIAIVVNNVIGDALLLVSSEGKGVIRIQAVVCLFLSISPIKFYAKKLQFLISKGALPMPRKSIERTYKRNLALSK